MQLPVITRDTIDSSIRSYHTNPKQYTTGVWDLMIKENPEIKRVCELLFASGTNPYFQDGYLKGFAQCYMLMHRQAELDEFKEWLETEST